MKNSKELDFIINTLFNEINIKKVDYSKVNYEKISEITSSHLIIPCLYVNLRLKKSLSKIPSDFKVYLQKIYSINKERNLALTNELVLISNILKKNKIKHVFVKGSSHIISQIYNDLGERMVSDIDFLTSTDSKTMLTKIFDENGYFSIKKESFFNQRHLTPRLKKNFLFTIEPHTRLLEKKNHLLPISFLDDCLNLNKINVPNFRNQLLLNIYNDQINDNAYKKLFYNLRSLYDTKMLLRRLRKPLIPNDKFCNNYFFLASKKNINFKEVNQKNSSFFIYIRLYLKNKFLIYKYVENKVFNLIFFHKSKMRQIVELKNKKYRKHILIKIKKLKIFNK